MGFGASWLLDKITVDTGTGDRFYFHCGKWLASDKDDKQISRELPAVKEDSANYVPLTFYEVRVTTGDRFGAGTDSRVFITLEGQNGTKSNEVLLDNAQDNFERNKTDVFSVESVYLGELKSIRMRIDGTGIGANWFLDKVVVKSEKDGGKEWYFLCGSWLDSTHGMSRDIIGASQDGQSCLPMAKYKVAVTTGTFLEILQNFV